MSYLNLKGIHVRNENLYENKCYQVIVGDILFFSDTNLQKICGLCGHKVADNVLIVTKFH